MTSTRQSIVPSVDGIAPVPEDNMPGHHPEVEQDKPSAARRPRRTSKRAAGSLEARPFEVSARGLSFDGLQWGPDDGELALLLHGFPQTAEAWTAVAPSLAAEGFHVVAPNQRGYSAGARPRHVNAYRLDELVADALAWITELGQGHAHVVGHDWGGAVGWALASAHPEHIKSLTVVSTPHPRALLRAVPRSAQALRSAYVGFFSLPWLPERVLNARSGLLLRQLLIRTGLPETSAAIYADALGSPAALRAALSWYRASTWRPLGLARVGTVTVPTTYVWGSADTALGSAAAHATEHEVSGPYRFVKLEGEGHWLPETHVGLAKLIVEAFGVAS